MRDLFILLFCFMTSILAGQVQGVDYLMKYNCETNKYDVSIVILEGSATTIPQRVQFNSQISIVVPTRNAFIITDEYMPLQNNQSYTGTIPLDWITGIQVFAPAAQPENDFHSVFPSLSPPSFYNNLEQNDIVKLFSFTVGSSGEYIEGVRFFENGVDPASNAPGMIGADFSNGFTLGGLTQIYNGNLIENCITSLEDELSQEANVFPNPFQQEITIELLDLAKNISIFNSTGKLFYQSGSNTKRSTTINTNNYPSGVYFVKIENENGEISTRKIIKS